MPSSEQENAELRLGWCGRGSALGRPAPPFRFVAPRALIDWRALHEVDLSHVVRDTDVDALEAVLDVVAFGDIEAEDHRTLTPANFIQASRRRQTGIHLRFSVAGVLAAVLTASTSLVATAPSCLIRSPHAALPHCPAHRELLAPCARPAGSRQLHRQGRCRLTLLALSPGSV